MTTADRPEQREPGRNESGGTGSYLLMVAALAAFVAIAVGVGFLVPAASGPSGAAGAAPPAAPAPRASGAGPLMVSLTFDDGLAGQMQYLQALQQTGLTGTFYVNTGDIGQANYMSRADLTQIRAAGNEIGGHSVSHPNLIQDAPDETARQICDDRATLTSWGFDPVSFAYPFGVTSPAVEAAVRDCGYTSARLDHGLGPVSAACPNCVSGETIPPADPYAVRTPPDIVSSTTLPDLEAFVAAARSSGGGWLPFIFHHESCDTCGNLSTSPALLGQFAAWLADQQRAGTLTVRTVGQVVGGRGGPAHLAPAATSTSVANGDLAQEGSPVVPDCWEPTGYGQITADFRWAPPGPGSPASETVTVSSYTDGDAVMLPRLDLGQCTATISPGTVTHLAAQYRSTVPTQFAVYRRNGTGSWEYWTSGPWAGPTPAWQPITWDTPPAPPDTTGVAAGLVVGAVGSVQSTAYVQQAVSPPPLVSPGLQGLLEIGAIAAAALGLLGAAAGLAHHSVRRRRGGGDPVLPAPRPPDEGPPDEVRSDEVAQDASELDSTSPDHQGVSR